ncbi:MAG: peptide deformylase [Actinobacteria bacterium]|nr:peptide deformylase [Actinomycetota bacterium]
MNVEELMDGGRVLPITRWGEPVMHAPTKAVTVFDDALAELARDMFATMAASQGVGLAATQVGRDMSMFVFSCPDDDDVLHSGVVCNPVVTLPEGKDRNLEEAEEGCLSFPGAYELLARPDKAVCRGDDVEGNPVEIIGTGLLARCLQHETDHLSGVVFGDRLNGKARRSLRKKAEEMAYRYPADWPVSPKLPFDPEQHR